MDDPEKLKMALCHAVNSLQVSVHFKECNIWRPFNGTLCSIDLSLLAQQFSPPL